MAKCEGLDVETWVSGSFTARERIQTPGEVKYWSDVLWHESKSDSWGEGTEFSEWSLSANFGDQYILLSFQ